MKITEEQQKILDKAISLLEKYDKEDVSDYTYYFVVSEDDHVEISSEYDCCDNPECYKKTLAELKKDIPGCIYLYQDNYNDYENINSCYQCGRRLNDTLTWVYWEINDMEDKLEAEDIKQSHCAFRLRIIFKAMPTVDYEINEYEKKDPTRLKEAQERQDEFVCKVVGYAEQVIAVLDKEIDEDYNQIKPCPHKDCDYWGQGGCMLPGKCIYAGDNMEGRGVYE